MDWIIAILTFIGAVYLFIIISMAFKERKLIVGLAILNIVVFLYTFFVDPNLMYRYALSGAQINAGMGYTLITYIFLHATPAHLFLNMLGLLFFGYNIEKEYGGPQTIMVFFVSGMIAGGFYAMTSPATALVVGCSGAVFGLMAYLTLVRPFMISPMPFFIPMPVALAAVLYAIFAIPIIAAGDFSGGVAHNAHIGGLIGGSLMAFGMNYLQALKGLAIVVIIGFITVFVSLTFF